MPEIANWGNYPRVEAEEIYFESPSELAQNISSHDSLIARGMGRCYGDSSLGETVASTLHFNKITALDLEQGIITCHAGATLVEILNIIIPKGWFIPVSPGTKFITAGGAIAADVHGKNHHSEGSFSDHVLWFDIMMHDGTIVRCSKTENTELFHLTCGGMGLTGIILSVSFQLKKIETAKMRCEKIRATNLNEVMQMFDESSSWTYSVAWIDCLAGGNAKGRSIMMRGEHATTAEAGTKLPAEAKSGRKVTVPFYFPGFALNSFTVKTFNELYYHRAPKQIHKYISSFDSFFYPLDAILHWNKIYGRRGFTQYQCVLPLETSKEGLNKILDRTGKNNMVSFLAVLKLFGDENENILSFPKKGYTLGLDFPLTKNIYSLLNELDAIVVDHGGRIYLAKDMRVNSETMKRMYPGYEKFTEGIRKYNPDFKFRSLQSDRTGITK
ncbi:MAG TPA: FAD-binding oxidoreductase [Bacteroidia bacterium]|nr:FAD-binding oxidoreductase [Bacteroidia bacterium]